MINPFRWIWPKLPPIPEPQPVDPAAVAAGMRVFADDLEAGDNWALEVIGPDYEPMFTPEDWANYPTSLARRIRIAHFGKTGPGEIPWDVEDVLWDRLVAEPGTTP